MSERVPYLRAVVLDAEDIRAVADFWRVLLGFSYKPGHETVDPQGDDWLVLCDRAGVARLAIQRVGSLPTSTWPDPRIPQQLHLDLTVADKAELAEQRDRALELGATILEDRFDDPRESLIVFADPAGHPFCIFVSPDHPS